MEEANQSTEKEQGSSSTSCPILQDPTVTDGEEEDQGVTLVEVLEEQAKLEEDADAVLGGSDDKNCTYSMVCHIEHCTKRGNEFSVQLAHITMRLSLFISRATLRDRHCMLASLA